MGSSRKMNVYAVIMAGGVGTRFWPVSRTHKPKQFLRLLRENTMIQETVARLNSYLSTENILIIANEIHGKEIEAQLSHINRDNIIVEPTGRNTAPCIGLAALFVLRLDPEGIMAVLPADHLIEDTEAFLDCLRLGEEVVSQRPQSLATIGIHPTRPETGYGYIQVGCKLDDWPGRAFQVKTFAEKPNLATAQRFLKSGDFLWNSGMFIWKASTILREIDEHLPELYQELMEIQGALEDPNLEAVIRRVYKKIRGISIDYGVMEKAMDVCVIKGDFGWSDLGNWEEIFRISPNKDGVGNVGGDDHILLDCKRCFVHSPEKLVAMVGLEDVIVVETEDATLICKKDQSQDIRRVVDILRHQKRDQYL